MRTVNSDRYINGSAGDQLGNMTGSVVRKGPAIGLNNMTGYSYHITYDTIGSTYLTGTFQVQASNDPASKNYTDPTGLVREAYWTNVRDAYGNVLSASVIASGSGNSVVLSDTQAYYTWTRLIFTPTKGSGSMDVRFTAKGPA